MWQNLNLALLSNKIALAGLQTSDEVLLETRHFFSGAALYANGKICASLTPAGFGLKLPADVRNGLIEDGKGTELRYFEKAPVKREYVALTEHIVNDPDELRSLLELSIAYVLELMSQAEQDRRVDYIEFLTTDIAETKRFYSEVFGWEIKARVSANGGQIVRNTFEFPGGRRFHFADPSGNELAVWSDR